MSQAHIDSLKNEVVDKKNQIQQLETERKEEWETWSESQRELNCLILSEAKSDLGELNRLVSNTIIAYNNAKRAEQSMPFGQRPFSNEELKAMQQKLNIPLRKDDVCERKGAGSSVFYIETHTALEKARDIFGADYSIEVKGEPQIVFQGNTNGKNLVCVKAVVRLRLV